jgi:hypothetical protein
MESVPPTFGTSAKYTKKQEVVYPKVDFWNPQRHRKLLKVNGGRAGTRTPDLLRVKKPCNLLGFHGFLAFTWFLDRFSELLSLNA